MNSLENIALENEVQTLVPWANDYMDRFAKTYSPQTKVFVENDLRLIKSKCSHAAYSFYLHIYDRINENINKS